jgi:phenylpropionate dioxygenase-like ring-hydroxylating dioxygenase large terminal subunit
MFIHKNQLAYQLAPEWYFSPEIYDREIERIFLPTWHFVGSKSDLPNSGDFRTLELLGKPLLIRNFDGRHYAFLNVCSHRHCRLTNVAQGHSEQLRCQYHGWEYEASGRTRKIPDAGCFRPFDRENARLRAFRLEACGDLLFVSLAEQGPSLREFLGDFYDIVAQRTSDGWHKVWNWEHDYACNWKLAVENTVESYHLPCIHKGPFAAVYPSEEAQRHELHDDYSTLRYAIEHRTLAAMQAWAAGVLGAESTNVYTHHLVHPHFVVTLNDLVVHVHQYLPSSPTTSCAIARAYGYYGEKRNPWAWLLGRTSAWHSWRAIQQIQLEDASIFADAQRGIEATEFRGCIGTREERIYAFQRFVGRRCAPSEPASPPAPQSSAPHRPAPLGMPHPAPSESESPASIS